MQGRCEHRGKKDKKKERKNRKQVKVILMNGYTGEGRERKREKKLGEGG